MRPIAFIVAAALCLLGSRSAHAESEGICRVGLLVLTQPADGQTNVPTDIHLRAWIDGGAERPDAECQEGGDFSDTTLTLLKDGADVSATQTNALGWTEIKELAPDGPLEPNTTYTFRLSDFEPLDITFTTGDGPAPGPGPAPTLEILEAREDGSADGRDGRVRYQLSYRLTPGQADPDNLSFLRLTADDWNHAVFAVGPTDPIDGSVHYWGADGEPVCMTAVQVAANGSEVASEEVCVEPIPAGCHAGRTVRSGNGLWLVGLAFVALRVGRRRTIRGYLVR